MSVAFGTPHCICTLEHPAALLYVRNIHLFRDCCALLAHKEGGEKGGACATKPLSTRKKWFVLYAPSFARRMMWGAVTSATCNHQ